jgi:hypothetical protein
MVDATEERVGPGPRPAESTIGASPSSLFLLAFPLLPAGGAGREAVVAAGDRWTIDRPALSIDSPVVVWGHPPLRSGIPLSSALRFGAARERALLALRRNPPSDLPRVAVHRLPPPRLGGGRVRESARATLLGGAMVELSAEEAPPRVLDAVVSAAALLPGRLAIRPGSGGAVLVRGFVAGGTEAILRIAPAGSPADPAHAASGLQRLGPAEISVVPRLLGRGNSAGASWSLEGALPGRRPRGLTPRLLGEAARLCSVLPRAAEPPTSVRDDLETLATRFPDRGPALRRISGALTGVIGSLPTVVRHGDLWAGNLLVHGGRLSGVVDWDAWHPAGVPGADLLQLFGTELRIRAREELGSTWVRRPWRSGAFLRATAEYWSALGLTPDGDVLDAIGVAWWATEVAGTVSRLPERGEDGEWVEANLDRVLTELDT